MRGLIEAFSTRNEEGMRSALADDLTAYVTNAEGGVDQVHGRDSSVHRLLALQAPTLGITVTQSVAVASDQAMLMVEIQAEHNGRQLHNDAAFLATIRADQVSELWMVEAEPADSDTFWR